MYVIVKKPIFKTTSLFTLYNSVYESYYKQYNGNEYLKVVQIKDEFVKEIYNKFDKGYLSPFPIDAQLNVKKFNIEKDKLVEQDSTFYWEFKYLVAHNFNLLLATKAIELVEEDKFNFDYFEKFIKLKESFEKQSEDEMLKNIIHKGIYGHRTLCKSFYSEILHYGFQKGGQKILLSALTSHSAKDNANSFIYYNNDDYLVICDNIYNINNTTISCGVSMLSKVDVLSYAYHSLKKKQGEETAYVFLNNVKNNIYNSSPGKTLLYSTTKKEYKANKEFFNKFNGDNPSVTRYNMNKNSGNKIGTTILILK